MEPTDAEGKVRPWMSFQTFWTFLEELTAKPMPRKLDRSMMTTKSGTDQNNIMAAMQTFGLIDEGGGVLAELETFQAADPDARKQMLGRWIHGKYSAPLQVSEENGTPQDLHNVFRDEYGMTGADTRRKAVTFFQHAAQHAGIELSPNFPKTRMGSGAPGAPRPKRTGTRKKKAAESNGGGTGSAPPASSGHSQTVELASGGTVTLTYDVNMFAVSETDEAFVLSLIRKLRKYPTVDGAEEKEEAAAS